MRKQQRQNTVKYVCANCGATENVPEDVLEYFDDINPQQLLFGSHQFTCEKCSTGIMKPEKEPEIIVRGYGIHEGFGED
jgi:DNA-directed RNA polymerase subunit RPC12/RpoP